MGVDAVAVNSVAETTQASWSCPPSSPTIVGNAVATIVCDSAATSIPSINPTSTVTICRWVRCGISGCAPITPGDAEEFRFDHSATATSGSVPASSTTSCLGCSHRRRGLGEAAHVTRPSGPAAVSGEPVVDSTRGVADRVALRGAAIAVVGPSSAELRGRRCRGMTRSAGCLPWLLELAAYRPAAGRGPPQGPTPRASARGQLVERPIATKPVKAFHASQCAASQHSSNNWRDSR